MALTSLKSVKTADFLRHDWIYRYDTIRMVKVHRGFEFKDGLVDAVEVSGSKFIVVTHYYLESSRMIERGH